MSDASGNAQNCNNLLWNRNVASSSKKHLMDLSLSTVKAQGGILYFDIEVVRKPSISWEEAKACT